MRKTLFLVTAIVVFAALPALAQRAPGLRNTAEGPIQVGEQPAYKIWIAEPHATWQDAVATLILLNGEAVMMKTGDADTPFVVLRQVTTNGLIQFPPAKYHASKAMTSMNEMVSYVAGHSWWRGMTTADGQMVVVTRNDQ